ncbi:MAG TPA: response regulator [Labilithrix sp.]|nr:response regulator [Labilithrix sp.]
MSVVRPRLMVIDDDAQLLRAIGRLLRAECEVVPLADADAALARLDGGERVDGILCDVNLGRTSGGEFYRTLCDRAPALASRTAFMTGGAASPSGREMIAKPFEGGALRDFVRGLLARAPTQRQA